MALPWATGVASQRFTQETIGRRVTLSLDPALSPRGLFPLNEQTVPRRWPDFWRRRRRRILVIAMMLSFALSAVLASYAVPARWAGRLLPGYSVVDSDAVALSPGDALEVAGRVSIDGDVSVFDPRGELLLLTVSIDSEVTVSDWIRSFFDDSTVLRTRASVYGDRTTDEQREHNRHLMENSKLTAIVVALEHLGFEAAEVVGVEFESTLPGGPAHGLIDHRETIVAIDGFPVTTVESLRGLLAERPPGTRVVIALEHAVTDEGRDVYIRLGEHPDAEGGFLGVSGVVERISLRDLPFDVDFSIGAVGGPSAGLAFTLATLDLLTPGELTGRQTVAVTGTIRFDGTVGDVGGVRQKAIAARSAGADVLIAPLGAVQEARSAAAGLEVIGVSSLDEALSALEGLGGDPAVSAS